MPTASNINWTPGQTIPNLVTVRLGTGGADAGKIKIFNAVGTANVIADVVGYYGAGRPASTFHALVADPHPRLALRQRQPAGPVDAGQTRSLDVTDTHGSGVPGQPAARPSS